ncbi:MAG TPA: pirin family protein [Phycisphaerales bacterium]|nr:pirin family protein [Phycisphaerales bacterium]HRQ74774.1 pirin family protein [Phycisphaerales bacterium]
MQAHKRVQSVLASPPLHWVGDGFPVSSVFSPRSVQSQLSPYVLFDYAGPVKFEPSDRPRGVDSHPHRGFETVTVVYQGELEHRDTGGNSGRISAGDVQWMTAASGVLHEEKHSQAFTQHGGVLEMAQLWVNLPAKHKMDPPRYQTILSDAIPTIDLPKGAGTVRLIAGDWHGTRGAASTFTPVILWDMKLRAGASVQVPIPSGFNAAVFMRSGTVGFDETYTATSRQLALLTPEGEGVMIHATSDAEMLIVGGEPIDEPVVAYGPFVMNTHDEIQQALTDLRAGRFGTL